MTDEAGERSVEVGRGGAASDQVRGALVALADGQLRRAFWQAGLARFPAADLAGVRSGAAW